MVAAVLARFLLLLSRPLWHDELFTVWISRSSLRDLVERLREDSGPPLFYILEKPLMAIGEVWKSDIVARALPFAAAAAIFALPLRRTREQGRGLFLMLCAASPLLLVYGAEARAYALLALLGFLLFELVLDGPPTAPRLWAAAGVCAAALWTHYLAIFLVAGCALVLLARRRLMPLLSLLGGLALFLPWMPILTKQPAPATAWMREPLVGAASGFLSVVGGAGRIPDPLGGPLPHWLVVAAQIVGGVLLFAVTLTAIRGTDPECRSAVALTLIVMALVLASSVARPVSFPGRSEMVILPIWLWAVARASVHGGPSRWVSIASIAIGTASCLLLLAVPKPESDVSRAVSLLRQWTGPGDQIVATGAFYLPARLASERGELVATVTALPRDLASHPGWFETAPLSREEILQLDWPRRGAPSEERLFLLVHPFQYTPPLVESLAERGAVKIIARSPDALVIRVSRSDGGAGAASNEKPALQRLRAASPLPFVATARSDIP